ncbi:cellulose biosynthesis protein BcsN [Methylobacterium durans]|nr:cellulose biosynthesis protein BcsN [Methylobacterium durans]
MTDLPAYAGVQARRLFGTGLALAVVCLALPACTTTQGRQMTSRAAPDAFFSSLDTRAPTKSGPLVTLPRSGAVVSLQETSYANGRRQRISLEGSNTESRIEIMLRTGGRGGVPMEKPTRAGVAGELAKISSDGAYRIVRRPMRNRYGEFGVALSDRCAYAWQWIDNLRHHNGGSASWTGGEIAASLRIQHCQRRPSPSEVLLADLQRLDIRTSTGQEPVREARPRRQIARSAEQQQPAPTPAAPVVPPLSPPPVAVNNSRTLVTVAPEAPRSPQYLTGQPARPESVSAASGELGQTFAVPRPSGQGGASLEQPRFLTERIANAGDKRPSEAAPPPPPVRAAQPDRLSADVPAQAYRGPVPPPFGW